MRPPISSQTPETLRAWLGEQGEKPYRATQILKWVHQHFAGDWTAMTNLSESLQAGLGEAFEFSTIELARKQGDTDTTQKFLWKLRDHQLVESVLIPASPALYGEPSDRHTLCVSTQVGCAYGCTFCASGLDGFKRNLEPAEIIDQVLAVERAQGRAGQRAINNLVIMGMGEPLANYENLMAALEILNPNMERIMASLGQDVPETKPILEINPTHPLVEKLKTNVDEDVVKVLFDQAVLAEGGQLKDPAEFVKRMNKLND